MQRRSPGTIRAALVGLLATGLVVTALSAPAGASTGPGRPTSTVVAGTPVLTVDVTQVQVVATAPLWSFARSGIGPAVPISWHETAPLPPDFGLKYDVEFRQGQGLYGPSFGPTWWPLVTGTTATSAVLQDSPSWTAENGDAYEFHVRAVDPVNGTPGPWSAPVFSNIPLDDNWHHQTWESGVSGDLVFGSHWSILTSPYAFYGTQHTTTARTRVSGGLGAWHGHTLYVFGTRCPTCGKFTIDMQAGATGNIFTRPVTVDTYSPTTRYRAVLYQVAIPGQLLESFQINTLATPHRPRIVLDAWGVAL
jgi:hypothetical protein